MTCCPPRARASHAPRRATLIAPPRRNLVVLHDDDAASVDLSSLAPALIDGRAVVSLTDVCLAGASGAPYGVALDFVSDDGFDTSTERGGGMPSYMLPHGWIDLATRDLHWTIEVPSFFHVRKVAAVIVRAAGDLSGTRAAPLVG